MSIKWSDFETMIIEGPSFGNTFLEETEYQPTASATHQCTRCMRLMNQTNLENQ